MGKWLEAIQKTLVSHPILVCREGGIGFHHFIYASDRITFTPATILVCPWPSVIMTWSAFFKSSKPYKPWIQWGNSTRNVSIQIRTWQQWRYGLNGPLLVKQGPLCSIHTCNFVHEFQSGPAAAKIAKQGLFYTFNGGIMVAKLVNIDSGCWMVGSVWGGQNHIVGWERPS